MGFAFPVTLHNTPLPLAGCPSPPHCIMHTHAGVKPILRENKGGAGRGEETGSCRTRVITKKKKKKRGYSEPGEGRDKEM